MYSSYMPSSPLGVYNIGPLYDIIILAIESSADAELHNHNTGSTIMYYADLANLTGNYAHFNY